MGYSRYNGILNIYKESGWTSMDVCAKLRGVLGVRKVGHAGTLDPMAEGVLLVALGKGTKDIPILEGETKLYRAQMLLGVRTDTQDITGQVIGSSDFLPDEESVRKVVLSFVGEYDQLTPMYSARKVKGKPLYKYARAGVETERKMKKVSIYHIDIESIDLPHVVFTLSCSSGTYVRTLCDDIGEKLGTLACMESLLRLKVGVYPVSESLSISEVQELCEEGRLGTALRIVRPTAVSIGKFDGTHLGHRALFHELRSFAAERGLRTLVIILKSQGPRLLSDEERLRRIYELGIDYCIELPFDEELKAMSAGDFIRDVLIERFSARAVVAGEDLSFGRGREGNADYLREHAAEFGIEVNIIRKIRTDYGTTSNFHESEDISSTLVRRELSEGRMEEVRALLGTPYSISGTVVHGRHIGTDRLDAPTLNIQIPPQMALPPRGVYAVRVSIGAGTKEQLCFGIANLGTAPTMESLSDGFDPGLRLEVHIFSYTGDAYGAQVKVELLHFIRPEKKFESESELRDQIFGSDIPLAMEFADLA